MRSQHDTATKLDGFAATAGRSLGELFPLGELGASSDPALGVEPRCRSWARWARWAR